MGGSLCKLQSLRYLLLSPDSTFINSRWHSDLYKLWDLHIWTYMALVRAIQLPGMRAEKRKRPRPRFESLGRPSNSPPPELLNRRLDSSQIGVNSSVVPADGNTGPTLEEGGAGIGVGTSKALPQRSLRNPRRTIRKALGVRFLLVEAPHLPESCKWSLKPETTCVSCH
jgi:hypothetical protein